MVAGAGEVVGKPQPWRRLVQAPVGNAGCPPCAAPPAVQGSDRAGLGGAAQRPPCGRSLRAAGIGARKAGRSSRLRCAASAVQGTRESSPPEPTGSVAPSLAQPVKENAVRRLLFSLTALAAMLTGRRRLRGNVVFCLTRGMRDCRGREAG